MRKIFLFIGIIMFSISNYAQNIPFKIQKSEIFKDEYKKSQIVLSEEDGNGGIIIVRSYEGGFSNTKGYYIEQYDSELKLIKEKEYEMKHPITHKNTTVLGVFKMGNEVKIIEMFYDINEKAYLCFANSIDISNFNSETKELFKLTRDELNQYGGLSLSYILNEYKLNHYVISGDFSSDESDGGFFFGNSKQAVNSNPETNSGIVFIVNKEKKTFAIGIDMFNKNDETLKIHLFDEKLNKKMEHVFKKDLKDSRCIFQNLIISNDGNSIFLLSKLFTKEMSQKDEGGKYVYEIVKFTGDKEENQIINPNEHFIGSLKLITIDDKLVCVGFYSDIKDNKYKGLCFFELDPNSLKITNSKYNPFTEQFIIDKFGEYKDKELKYLKFKNSLITENNDIIFNAEESYTTTSAGSSSPYGGGSPSQTVYHFDDIVSVKISSDGELIWARNINKRQIGEEYSSYTTILKNNNPYFIINAKDKIKELSDNRIEFKGDRNLNIIRVNQKGDFDYEEILNDDENEVPFMVSKGITSGNSVLFIGRKGKKKQLLKITL